MNKEISEAFAYRDERICKLEDKKLTIISIKKCPECKGEYPMLRHNLAFYYFWICLKCFNKFTAHPDEALKKYEDG